MAENGINILATKKGVNSYTHGLLNYLAEWSGMQKEDVELVSVCDIEDMALLTKPKSRALRIIGGPDAFNDQLYQLYGDAVVIGEGFEFFKDYKELGSLDEVLKRPYVCTPDKSEVVASTLIDWNLAPAMKTGPRKIMVLGGRGCHNKCKFCFTSWTTKHQVAPDIKGQYKEHTVNVITNDSEGTLSQKVAVRSITVKKYLSMTEKEAKLCRYYRFGLESFTEAGRKAFAKPIKNEELRAVCQIAKMMNHDIQFFVIMGIEPQESILEFLEAVGKDASKKPRIIINGTYFNPCLHTPLQDYDIRKLYDWDAKYIYGALTEYGGRYRTIMAHDAGHHIWRGLMHRVRNIEEGDIVWKLRNKKRKEIEDIIEKNNLTHLWTDVLPSKVIFDWRKDIRVNKYGPGVINPAISDAR